jgi:pSer/pThr/pTyr-binding forkhead associated (FHA) protein
VKDSVERLSERYEVNLIGHRGAVQDLVFKILAEDVTIGRHSTNDIVLEDPAVSAQHARIRYDGLGFEILDLGSRGGVRVNTRPVQTAEIRDGDRIRLGSSVFIFSVKPRGGGASAAPEAAGGSLMTPRPQLDAAARVRLAAYGVVILILLGLIVLMLGGEPEPAGPRGAASPEERVDIGPLAIQQFTPPAHQPTQQQVREASVHLQRGLNELDSGNLLQAIVALKLALESNPTCEPCKEQLEWAYLQLRRRIAYHVEAGDDDFKNLRYPDAVRHWDVVRKLVQPRDPIFERLGRLIEQARHKQAELDRRAVGLP